MKKNVYFLVIPLLILTLVGLGFMNDDDKTSDRIGNNNYILVTQDITPSWGYNYDNPLAVLYTQNELVSHPGQGQGGADVSAITSPGTLYGFGAQGNLGYWMADDFTIPTGQTWRLDSVKLYSYQTGSSTTSTITGSRLYITLGRIDSSGRVRVTADSTANRMVSTYWANMYRTTSTPPFNTQTTRPVMAVVDTVKIDLVGGYYWLAYNFTGSLTSGPWNPPRTILGQPNTGNAKQYTTTWAAAMDGSNPQGVPFVIYGTNITGITTTNGNIPASFKLEQNYPNPFNPSTTIKFGLPKATDVKIIVTDINGKIVRTLVDMSANAGNYQVAFDANNLSTGIYFYKIIAGDFSQTKKMLLVK
jgi:hypothetical protein